MRILIGAFGTRGDVQPMLALAQALKSRGHELLLAVPPSSRDLAVSFGIQSLSVGMDYGEISRRAAVGGFRDLVSVLPLVRGEVGAQLDALEGPASDSDVIVGSSVFTVGTILSEQFRKPFAFIAMCPQLFPSKHHPSPMLPWHGLPKWMNQLSWTVSRRAWNLLLRKVLNDERRRRKLGNITDVWSSLIGECPIGAFDPSLAPAPHDHRVPIAQFGALFVEEEAELSPATEAFLQDGPAPVYIGFGSMSDPDPKRTTERLLNAVARAGVRALISRGWAGLGADVSSSDVLFIGSEPHGKLFSRCSAVVHHGGAGTTHAAARAGVPQVLMPQLMDQHYWAHRLGLLGVSPGNVSRHDPDPGPLAAALGASLRDEELRARARSLGPRLRMDGAFHVAQFIERMDRSYV